MTRFSRTLRVSSGWRVLVKRADVVCCLTVGAVGAVLRCCWLDLVPFQNGDSIRYWAQAKAIASGNEPWWRGPQAGLSLGGGFTPLGGFYFVLLTAARWVTSDPLGAVALGALMGSVGAALTYPLARLFLPVGPALGGGHQPVWIHASRETWNPAYVFCFAALFHLSLAPWAARRDDHALPLAAYWAGLCAQLHVSSVALLLPLGVGVGLRRPRLALACALAFVVSFLPSLVRGAPEIPDQLRSVGQTLGELRHLGGAHARARHLFSWPLPYLPPLSALGPSDFVDRCAAKMLTGDSDVPSPAILSVYWKRADQTWRGSHLAAIPAKVALHAACGSTTLRRFWVDAACSWALCATTLAGVVWAAVRAVRDPALRVLAVSAVSMLILTRFPGMGTTPHAFFVFFPLPAVMAAMLARGRRMRPWVVACLLAVAVGQAGLQVDRMVELGRLGGAPSYGVPHRHRARVARWLRERGVQRIGNVMVIGNRTAWSPLLRGGGKPSSYAILELTEEALGRLCPAPEGCLEAWISVRRAWEPYLVLREGGVWVYRRGDP